MLLFAGFEGSPNIYMAATAMNLVHNYRLLFQQVLVLDSHQMSVEGGCRSEDCLDVVSSAYPFTQACNVGDERCCSGLFCWFSRCVGFAGHLYKGLRISVPFQDSSEVVLFSLYILLLDNGSCLVEEARDHTLSNGMDGERKSSDIGLFGWAFCGCLFRVIYMYHSFVKGPHHSGGGGMCPGTVAFHPLLASQ